MLNIIMDYRMVPLLSTLSLALCHEALEGGGYQQMGTIKYAKRNFPSCSLRSQFTASQKPPLLFPNAKTVVSVERFPSCGKWLARGYRTMATAHGSLSLAADGLIDLPKQKRYSDILSQAKSATTNFSSLRSLNSAHQVALRGRRIPSPARYSFASLAITSLPDSPAPRLHQYIGVRFLLIIGVYHELVNSNSITLYEHQA